MQSRSVHTNSTKNKKVNGFKVHTSEISRPSKYKYIPKTVPKKIAQDIGDLIVKTRPFETTAEPVSFQTETRYTIPNVYENVNIVKQAYFRTHDALLNVLLEIKKFKQEDQSSVDSPDDRDIQIV